MIKNICPFETPMNEDQMMVLSAMLDGKSKWMLVATPDGRAVITKDIVEGEIIDEISAKQQKKCGKVRVPALA